MVSSKPPSGAPQLTSEDFPPVQPGSSISCLVHNGAPPSCPVHSSSLLPSLNVSMPATKSPSVSSKLISEETPLLGPSIRPPLYNSASSACPVHTSPLPPRPPTPTPHPPSLPLASSSTPRRWSSMIALVLLCISAVGILSLGFFAPAAAAKYVKEAITLDVSSLSVESFTDCGIRARVQATVAVDASRVRNSAIRTFGRVGTWLARKVTVKDPKVYVYLLGYGGSLLGTATAPSMVIDIRNGRTTPIDFISEVETGPLDVIQRLANDYINGRLKLVRMRGEADIPLKSGLLSLGTRRIFEEMAFEGYKYKQQPIPE